jgi:hypothetical protein
VNRGPASVALQEANPRQRAALYPVLTLGLRLAVSSVAVIEVSHERGEDAAALLLIGDDGGDGRQVSDYAMLEVEGEARCSGLEDGSVASASRTSSRIPFSMESECWTLADGQAFERLTGDAGDKFEVLVQVQDRQAGQLRRRGDDQVWD